MTITAGAARWLAVAVIMIIAYLIAHPHIAETWQLYFADSKAKTIKPAYVDPFASREVCDKQADASNNANSELPPAQNTTFWSCHRTYQLEWGWRAAS